MSKKTLINSILILTHLAISSFAENPQPPSQSDQLFALRQAILDSGETMLSGSRYGVIPFKDYGTWHVSLIRNPPSLSAPSDPKDPTSYRTMIIGVKNVEFQGSSASVELTYCTNVAKGKEFRFSLLNIAVKGMPTVDENLLSKLGVNLDLAKKNPNQQVDPTVKTPVESGNVQGTAGHP